MRFPAIAAALLALASAAQAQVRPQPGTGDPHLQSVLYDPDQVVQLQLVPGFQLTIEFAPDERIENVAVGDSNAWSVTPNRRGDLLFVKLGAGGAATNMTVVTDARRYVFDLVPAFGQSADTPYALRFRYPDPATATAAPGDPAVVGRYKLGGARGLRPSAISDDGAKTYIVWAADRPLPAIFSVDGQGHETLAAGAMRDGRYVIDGVADRLLFRLDREAATARRWPRLRR